MISKEDADKLKKKISRKIALWSSVDFADFIDELTEAPEDPNKKYVGTDRLMVGTYMTIAEEDVSIIGHLLSIDSDGYHIQEWDGHVYICVIAYPYLSDTVYYIRQMVDKGKVIQDNTGAYMKFEDDTVWWRHGWEQKWEMADSSTNNISRIADHQWHTVDSEGE